MPNIFEEYAYIAKRLKEIEEQYLQREDDKEDDKQTIDGEYPQDYYYECA